MVNEHADTRPMTVGGWMLTLLVLAIPIVNLVMYLVWALSGSGNVNRRNFCRASIYWFLIILGIYILFMALVGVVSVANSLGLIQQQSVQNIFCTRGKNLLLYLASFFGWDYFF